MHPAPSVIIFSTISGVGFGMLFWLGLGLPAVTGWVAFAFFVIAYALAVGGLISSTFHLGRPERAWRAFTQWRTSWLSREGWAAVLALVIMALFGAGAVFLGRTILPIGVIGSVLSLLTVLCTAMIYTQLKTVPRWNHWTTPALFLLLSLGGGALFVGEIAYALPLISAAAALQVVIWITGDQRFAASGSNLGTATGLGDRGAVRSFEPPHTGSNYLLKEMAFVVGRRHASRLRILGLVLMAGAPVALLLLPFTHILAALAALSHLAGVFALRWLFFAEAEHVVGLYYGRR